jgi:hypothetical protein
MMKRFPCGERNRGEKGKRGKGVGEKGRNLLDPLFTYSPLLLFIALDYHA